MNEVEIYTTPFCPFCLRAKTLLAEKGVYYTEIDVSKNSANKVEMLERSQRRTVPQIFIGAQHIGGSDDLAEADRSGLLEALLAEPA